MSKFTQDEITLAKEVQSKYGVPASITLAQYALESGYGKSTVGKNNYFNIKGSGRGGYRDYDDKRASFMDFGTLLSGERYTSKTSGAKNVKDYIQGVKDAGYATDPKYVPKVMSIIQSNNLTQYDTGEIGNNSASIDVSGNGANSLPWYGDIVRVVLILIAVAAGFGLIAVSVGGMDAKKIL